MADTPKYESNLTIHFSPQGNSYHIDQITEHVPACMNILYSSFVAWLAQLVVTSTFPPPYSDSQPFPYSAGTYTAQANCQ